MDRCNPVMKGSLYFGHVHLTQTKEYLMKERTILLIFLIHCFNSLVCLFVYSISSSSSSSSTTSFLSLLVSHSPYFHFTQEVDLIREQVQRLVSLTIWANLLPVCVYRYLRHLYCTCNISINMYYV